MNFLQSALLAGLALTAVPLILHLLTRRRVRDVEFPALMFLLGSKKRSLKLLTLKQWLVLFCRMAALACIVIAVSLPVVRNHVFSVPGSKSPSSVYLLIDDTQSMGWELRGVSLLERAGAAASKIVRGADGRDEIYFETLCGRGGVYTSGEERKKLELELKNISLGWCDADPGVAAQKALDYLKKTPFSERRLILISDFQENSFKSRRRISSDPGIEIVAIDLAGAEPRDNVIVSGVKTPLFPLVGESIPVCYELLATGPGAPEVNVSLEIDGARRGERSAAGEGDESGNCFFVTIGESGRHTGVVEISGDNMDADNYRYFVLDVSEGIDVAIISPGGRERDPLSDTFYMLRALGSVAGAGPGEKSVNVRIVDPKDVGDKTFGGTGVVFVPGDTELTNDIVNLLGEYAASGGGVFITAGASASGEILSRSLFSGGITVTKRQEKTPAAGEKQALVMAVPEKINGRHPVFGGKAGSSVAEDIMNAGFYNPVIINIENPETERVISFAGSESLLVERRLGGGRVMLMASGLTPEHTNFSLRPSFVPFMLQVARYLSPGSAGGAGEFVTGESTVVSIGKEAAGGKFAAISASGERIPMNKSGEGGAVSLQPEGALSPGIYSLTGQDGESAGTFVVNAPSMESDLRGITGSEREAIFGGGGSVRWIDAGRALESGTVEDLAFTGKSSALWYLFSIAAALFLIAETALANRR